MCRCNTIHARGPVECKTAGRPHTRTLRRFSSQSYHQRAPPPSGRPCLSLDHELQYPEVNVVDLNIPTISNYCGCSQVTESLDHQASLCRIPPIRLLLEDCLHEGAECPSKATIVQVPRDVLLSNSGELLRLWYDFPKHFGHPFRLKFYGLWAIVRAVSLETTAGSLAGEFQARISPLSPTFTVVCSPWSGYSVGTEFDRKPTDGLA